MTFLWFALVPVSMGIRRNIKLLVTGKYITVSEVTKGFETTEEEAKKRLEKLRKEKNVLEKAAPGVYVANSEVSTDELVKEFRSTFSDLRDDLKTNIFSE